ncbi:hypothetical protein [Siccirubricoccus sp. G192]|uniref:hypothetical protein n=1 Tax=Siccirubricoccus sp. G192 TaxID=2849651 RepID=UPI001C2CBCD5|nr:hypothetical protein [Siccirubricoccus sp. G192]MBV1797212.1 hypothetical protein [Siccirubricoccus sp. G192]
MSRKNHAAGAGGGKEKGRSAGDQQTGGVTGGKLGGAGSLRYHTDAGSRAEEAGRSGGQDRRGTMRESHPPADTEQEKLRKARIKKG